MRSQNTIVPSCILGCACSVSIALSIAGGIPPYYRSSMVLKEANKVPTIGVYRPSQGVYRPSQDVIIRGNNGYNISMERKEHAESKYIDRRISDSSRKIDEISQLEDNWNGYGAEKFSVDFIERVRGIVTQLYFQPDIYPTAENSIQFEYENSKGDYLEFELFDVGVINIYQRSDKGENSEELDMNDVKGINSRVKMFYGI